MARISLCLITGNCADYIERCLKSFSPLADEIIVVRAIGNQKPDDTLKLARSLGATTAQYENHPTRADWPHVDSFAAARNFSFNLAIGDYIFWCDTDDVFEGDPDAVRQLAERGGYPAFVFPYRIFARGVTVNRVRMMARGSGKWAFPVHEDFQFLIPNPRAIQDDRVVVTHLPHFATKTGSNERNLRILRSIPDNEMTPGLWFHLHSELAAVGQMDESIEAAKRALASPDVGKAESYEIHLNFAGVAKDPQQKEAFLHAAYKADPERREALGLLANHALNYRCNAQALAYARQMMATDVPAQPEWNHREAIYGWVGDDTYAQALRANGHRKEAEAIRRSSLQRAGGPRIALVHATRGRPEQAALARKLWLDLAERPDRIEHLFVYDNDDPESQWLSRFHSLELLPGGGCVNAWNHGAFATEAPVIVQLSDDWMPPAKWDEQIFQRLADASEDFKLPRVLAVSDGLRADDLLCMAICTRTYLFADQFLFHPWFTGVFSDNWFTELAYQRGAVIDARDLVFAHNHPIKTGKPLDATYQTQNAPERYHEGKKLLEYLRLGNDWSSVPGWFDYWPFYDMIARRLKSGDRVAEIGVWMGRSIIFLAQTLQRLGKDVKIFAVDTFRGEENQPAQAAAVISFGGCFRAEFERNIRRCGVADMIEIIEGDSAVSASMVRGGSLAFAFIDAAHEYEPVKRDIAAWRPKLKPGGILSGHDARYEPVARAVREWIPRPKFANNVWIA